MAGLDVDVQVGADEEDFNEGIFIRVCREIPFSAHKSFSDRTDELKLRATKKKGRGFGGEH